MILKIWKFGFDVSSRARFLWRKDLNLTVNLSKNVIKSDAFKLGEAALNSIGLCAFQNKTG